jgi:hypothetical protein
VREQVSFLVQALRFFRKTFFEELSWIETVRVIQARCSFGSRRERDWAFSSSLGAER